MTIEKAVRSVISNIPEGFPFEQIFRFEEKPDGLYVRIAPAPNATKFLLSLNAGLGPIIDLNSNPSQYYPWKLYSGSDAQEKLKKIRALRSHPGDDDL